MINTDSASWDGMNTASGYLFAVPSGGYSCAVCQHGTLYSVVNSNWLSIYSEGGAELSQDFPTPNAPEFTEGSYNFAISIHKTAANTSEIKWYLIKDNNSYWFGGSVVDSTNATSSLSAISLGINDVLESTGTKLSMHEVSVDTGIIEIPPAPFEAHYISKWGADPLYDAWPILRDSTYLSGNASLGGETPVPEGDWASIRGVFDADAEAEQGKAVVISGKMTINGGFGFVISPIRYALHYFEDPGTLENENTDSAAFVGAGSSSGYSFMPISGSGIIATGNGGGGTNFTINNGSWISTYGNNGKPIGTFYQVPKAAEMVAGTYEWAISVESINEVTNEIRFYLLQENDGYYYAGVIQDTAVTKKFNAVSFGFRRVNGFTKVDFESVEVKKGDPLEIIYDCFCENSYISKWGFIGDRFGSGDWTLTPGTLTGNARISGSAGAGFAAVRGDFFADLSPNQEEALVLEGEITFEGGNIDDPDSFMFGIFNAQNSGSLDSTQAHGFVWNGSESQRNGYLIKPASKTIMGISNSVWHDNSATGSYEVYNSGVSSPLTIGTYDFAISIMPGDEGMDVRYSFRKDDGSFFSEVQVTDTSSSLIAESFNGISFAINNPTTTALDIQDVRFALSEPLPVYASNEGESNGDLPMSFELHQNFPNPFNPSTVISYQLPMNSKVTLKVFDMLGREVARLVDGRKLAGNHQVTFNASNLSSGMYFFRLDTEDFSYTRKMTIIK